MSTNPSTLSKPRAGKAAAPIAKTIAAVPPAPAAVPPTSVSFIRFLDLRRAPENVRKTRPAEDVDELADDIAAHGLLQSLIGYQDREKGRDLTYIVGGGRRLQALGLLLDRGLIDRAYQVPVVIREQDEAVELSLTENLQKRDMSPADECVAFELLMRPGNVSPDDLAKRFGYTGRYVRQRLRLAALADEILDALRDKTIGLESAMAYASTQDRGLQLAMFKKQARTPFRPHDPDRIRYDVKVKGIRTTDPLFTYVGAAAYERKGGGYEDDLFADASTDRMLDKPLLLTELAEQHINFQMVRKLIDLQEETPSLSGFLRITDLRLYSWGTSNEPKAPKGYEVVKSHDLKQIWKTIRNNRIDVQVAVGINEAGELAIWERGLYVVADQVEAVQPRRSSGPGSHQPSQAEVDKQQRDAGVDRIAWRLGVGSFARSPFEGRAYFPTRSWGIDQFEVSRDPRHQGGKLVAVQVFVTDAEFAAMRTEAEQRYDADLAAARAREEEKARRKARHEEIVAEIIALDPAPAVVVLDDEPYFRNTQGGWAGTREDAESEDPSLELFPTLADLLARATPGEPIETSPSLAAFLASHDLAAAL